MSDEARTPLPRGFVLGILMWQEAGGCRRTPGDRRRRHGVCSSPDSGGASSRSAVLSPPEQQRVAQALEDDAQVMSNTQLEDVLAGQWSSRASTSPGSPESWHR